MFLETHLGRSSIGLPQNTSFVSDRHQICFVDGFELQKAAAAVQSVSVFRASEGGSGSSNCKSEVSHIICLESPVCQVVLLRIHAFHPYISKPDL